MTATISSLSVAFPHGDPRAAALLADCLALGFSEVQSLEIEELFFLKGALSDADRGVLVELLVDRVVGRSSWDVPSAPGCVEVVYQAGVSDSVAEQLLSAAQRLELHNLEAVVTGTRYRIGGGLSVERLEQVARALLANATIQRFAAGRVEPLFTPTSGALGLVETVSLRGLSRDKLLDLSRDRRAALDDAEMLAVQAYFAGLGRDPSDAEFEMIAQTWSEHCVHKTFRAEIEVTRADGSLEIVDGLLNTYIRGATEKLAASWVVSAFVDNAGILEFDDDFEVAFKVETHNHPSAIEPFGGANTGVGGVVRDVLGVSARPIAATDVLCFGPQDVKLDSLPAGVLHPRRIGSGVVAGVQDYGNKLGVPIVNGAVFYHPGYIANPLVFCGCLGILPRGSHPCVAAPGDRVVVLGGRTGRDGLRGATFSSMTMEADTGSVAGASVQIGNPFVEKALIEVIVAARDQKLYSAVTDCGAGGLSSAVGEMAGRQGADVEIGRLPLKYPGLLPWEIWLSEAQERMVLAVPAARLEALQVICLRHGVEVCDIGAFQDSDKLTVRFQGAPIIELDCALLHDGPPRRHLKARVVAEAAPPAAELRDLLEWLSDPNICSRENVIRRFDHEVQGASVVRPLVGLHADGPSDGAVLRPLCCKSDRGIVLAVGLSVGGDAYAGAWAAVDEAVRNAVAVGADPDRIALLDNFCWGDPHRPETLGTLVEAARGCHDAAMAYKAPFVSGKDSLNNEYRGENGERRAIPGTLLISSLAFMGDVRRAVTSDLKQVGNPLFLIESALPALDLYRSFHRSVQAGQVAAAHDLSEGGLAVALAEMCIGGRLGAQVRCSDAYTEAPGRLLVEIWSQFEAEFAGTLLGYVSEGDLILNQTAYSQEALLKAWKGSQ